MIIIITTAVAIKHKAELNDERDPFISQRTYLVEPAAASCTHIALAIRGLVCLYQNFS